MVPCVGLPVSPIAVIVAVVNILVVDHTIDVVLDNRVNKFILDALRQVDLDFLPCNRVATEGIIVSDVFCCQRTVSVGEDSMFIR